MNRAAALALALRLHAAAHAEPLVLSGAAERDGRSWPVTLSVTVSGERAEALVDLPAITAYARPFTGTLRGRDLALERVSPSGARLAISGALDGDAFTGRFSGFGFESPLALRRVAGPDPIRGRHREVEVRFENGTTRLAGTIVLPAASGRSPGVVFTHGGAAETRAYSMSIAILFARRGIASLVYDKRGTGESTGDWESASLGELADDALAAHARLLAHPEVASAGIYGYSQGGWIGPLAATRSPKVSFVVAGGLSGVNPQEQTVHHRVNMLRQAGFDETVVARAVALWRRLYDADFGRGDRAKVAEEIRAVSKEPWFPASALPVVDAEPPPKGVLELLAFEPLPVWRKVRVPVLAFWGDEDVVVPVAESRRLVSAALIEGGNRDFTFRLHPRTPHELLQRAESGWDFPHQPRGLYEEIAAWILHTIRAS